MLKYKTQLLSDLVLGLGTQMHLKTLTLGSRKTAIYPEILRWFVYLGDFYTLKYSKQTSSSPN